MSRPSPFELLPSDVPHVEKLRRSFQEVLAHAEGGTSYETITVQLCIPVGTVKSRLNRARLQVIALRAAAVEGGAV
ncbi:MAG: hypothetical protein H0U63_04230 [Burkholderiales bacterium]|nr:hypothetical protein [Burkholderiales bacterium]